MVEGIVYPLQDLIQGRQVSSAERKRLVKDSWESVAAHYGMRPDGNMRDQYARKLNTQETLKYIAEGDRIIDVGCGNGVATVEYARVADYTLGVDYVEAFVEAAAALRKELVDAGKLEFAVADVTDLGPIKEQYGQFDKVVCERTLINLSCWDEQRSALGELLGLLRLGGHLLLSEVTIQGHERVDKLRTRYGLEPLEKHWNNIYIDEPALFAYMSSHECQLVHSESFSLYVLLSKVLNAFLALPYEPNFDDPINKLAFELSEDFSIQEKIGHTVFFLFKKQSW